MKKYIHAHMLSLLTLLLSCLSSLFPDILKKDPIFHLPIIVPILYFSLMAHVFELYNENSQLLDKRSDLLDDIKQQAKQNQNKIDSLNETITNKNTEIDDLKRKFQTNDIVAFVDIAADVKFIKGAMLATSSNSLLQSVPNNGHEHPSVHQNSD